MRTIAAFAAAGAILAIAIMPAAAQGGLDPSRLGNPGSPYQSNNTGGSRDVIIPRGATGADTFTSNSAAGGNASRPEQAVPNGSANGGGGGAR